MSGFRAAVGFLTRVPVGESGPPTPSATKWFPTIGALVGLVVAAVYTAAYQVMPSPLAALAAVVLGVLITGAFHEDGFADTSDGLGSRTTGERALEIMKDSRLGTYGTIAIVVSITWRVLAVGALDPVEAVAALVMAHTLGRAGAVVLMAVAPPAREDGLGRAGVLGATGSGVGFAMVSAAAIAGLIGGWWVLPAALVAGLALVWLRMVAVSRFGGITGDVLGAGEQLGEMAVLAVIVALTWTGPDPWWAG